MVESYLTIRHLLIDEFPKDSRLWIVNWIGAVTSNPRISTEPKFQITLSPLRSNSYLQLDMSRIASPQFQKCDDQQNISIGVGQLPLIAIGSIWHNGRRLQVDAGENLTLNRVLISASSTKVVNADHCSHGKPLIPRSLYVYGDINSASKIVAVTHNGDPYGLLIPAMELLRFYYAVSTDLSLSIFSGHFNFNRRLIVNPDRTHYVEEQQRCVLGLRQRFSNEDGWVIGRVICQRNALEAVEKPYAALIKDNANCEPRHIETAFPFEGHTTLKLRTRSLQSANSGVKRLLVLSMEQCSGAFPFENLTVDRDNNSKKANPETDIPYEDKLPAFGSGNPRQIGGLDIPLQSEFEPSYHNQPQTLSLPSQRFNALSGKEVDMPDKDQSKYANKALNNQLHSHVDKLGSAPGTYSDTKIASLSVVLERVKKVALPASFETFKTAVEL